MLRPRSFIEENAISFCFLRFHFQQSFSNDALFNFWSCNEFLFSFQTAPKDQLLVFELKDGWGPLCKFLGVEVPNKPFPHENKNAEFAEKFFRSHPLAQRIKREALISGCCLTALLLYGSYKLARNPSSIKRCFDNSLQFFNSLKLRQLYSYKYVAVLLKKLNSTNFIIVLMLIVIYCVFY